MGVITKNGDKPTCFSIMWTETLPTFARSRTKNHRSVARQRGRIGNERDIADSKLGNDTLSANVCIFWCYEYPVNFSGMLSR